MKYIGNLDLLMKNDIEFPSQEIFRKNLSHVEVDLTFLSWIQEVSVNIV